MGRSMGREQRRPAGPSAELSRTYRVILVAGAAFLAITGVELGRIHRASHRTDAWALVKDQLVEGAFRVDAELGDVVAHVESMQRTASARIGEPGLRAAGSQLAEELAPTADGRWYSLGSQVPDERAQRGNVLVPAGWTRSSEECRFLLAVATQLVPLQAVAHERDPLVCMSFYRGADGSAAVYPWMTPSALSQAVAAVPVAGSHGADDAEAPAPGGASWTPVYRDPASGARMVSCRAPVGDGRTVRAAVGATVNANSVAPLLTVARLPRALVVLVDDRARVVWKSGDPLQAASAPALDAVLPAPLRSRTAELLDASRDDRTPLDGFRACAYTLSSAPWSAVCVVREGDLDRGFLRGSAGYGVFAAALCLLVLLLQSLLRAHFVAPALALVDHIRTEATAGPTPIPQVPASWRPWFREISDLLPLKTLATNLPGAIFQFVRHPDGRAEVPFVSHGVQALIGVSADAVVHSVDAAFRLLAAQDLEAMAAEGADAAADMRPVEHELEIVTSGGERKWVQIIAQPRHGEGGDVVWDGIALDITARRLAEKERERLVQELREALGQIRTLRGLLPMCSSCKRVRDDLGYWHEVECFIRDHSDAEPTHGLCPECLRELYPDYSSTT